ncbi:MAG: VOC family protein [Nitrospiria bacterium]
MGQILFHLAFPVHSLEATREFYVDGLGCKMGRTSSIAMTLNFKGHQIIAHLTETPIPRQDGVYPRHFGLVLKTKSTWQGIVNRAEKKSLLFYQKPRCRFPHTRLEHLTFFLEDPSGNLLEFKHYRYDSAILGEAETNQIGDLAPK